MKLIGFVSKVSTISKARAWPHSDGPLHDEPQEKAHVLFFRKEDWDADHKASTDPGASQCSPALAGHLDLFNAVGEGPAIGSHFEIEIP